MLEHLELSYDDFAEIKEFTEQSGLDFISTGYDDESIEMLESIGTKIFKVASADLVNRPLLDKLVSLKKPLILSTGMATMQEIERTVKYLLDNNPNQEISPASHLHPFQRRHTLPTCPTNYYLPVERTIR